uniref:Acyl-CoA dehydrogenase n=1 Tax=candidate division WOR-3 bacterium TaxID=2052148 RepID=A0A7V4E4K8_UNCW3
MNFEIFEDQKQIKILIKKFCQKELNEEYLKEIEMRITRAKTKEEIRKLFPWHLLDKLHEIGIRQLAIPQKYGGTAPEQQVNITLTLAAEEIGYWGGNLVGIVMIPWIFLRAIAIDKTINEDQRKWIFQKFVQDSRFLIATAVGEASSCTDIHYPYDEGGSAILKCKGFKEDGCWIIDGEKAYCSGGAVAHLIMVAVRTNPEGPVSEAMSFFWIPTNLPGVTITPHQMLATDLGGNCQI